MAVEIKNLNVGAPNLKAPFPWFGGKSVVSGEVWNRFIDAKTYLEPFFGSGAVLLDRPRNSVKLEIVNDKNAFISNFWRAVQYDPEGVVKHASFPTNEIDLHARNAELIERSEEIAEKCMGDPRWFDSEIAGWWVWGMSIAIGGNWCQKKGPWVRKNGRIVKGKPGDGFVRAKPEVLNGRGIVPLFGRSELTGVIERLSERFESVKVLSGDWSRCCSDSLLGKSPPTAVFLDPPYSHNDRDVVYSEESFDVANDVREWCKKKGDERSLRIALCGYEGEHNELEEMGWEKIEWKAHGGYSSWGESDGNGRKNSRLERIWFSPHCQGVKQGSLF